MGKRRAKAAGSSLAFARLLELGKDRGYLTYEEANDALPQDIPTDEIDRFLITLDEFGVDLIDQDQALFRRILEFPEGLRQLETLLRRLTYRQREIVKLRFGIGDGQVYTRSEVGYIFRISPARVRKLELESISKLRQLGAEELFQLGRPLAHQPSRIAAKEVLETVTSLSPFLMEYLRRHHQDLDKLDWHLFETLVAECLASRGFESVRLVGRNANTSADIFAVEKLESTNVRIRYFVETKRWSKKIGIEVIDRVYGAMLNERPQWGWHLAMIVSLVGFKDLRKFSPSQLELMGVELRSREDIVGWLRDYKPSDRGLWLPAPMSDIELPACPPSDSVIGAVFPKAVVRGRLRGHD